MSDVYATGATSKPSTVWKCCAGMKEPYSISARPAAQVSTRRFTASTSPTSRNISSASASPGMMLASVPACSTPTLTVVGPRSGSVGKLICCSRGSSSIIGSIAERPRCGYAECASRPRVRTMTRSEPLAPEASLLSVGSPLMRKRLVAGSWFAARAPSEPFSSPTTNSRSTRSSPEVQSRSAAASIAAAIPLASQAPRPKRRSPSSRGRTKGGTVSRCVESVTPPPRRDAHTLPRPGVTSCTVTFHPRATSQRATKSTAFPSRPVGDWMETSSAAMATTSVMRQTYARVVAVHNRGATSPRRRVS
jgi:hypothetical protein